MTWEELILAHQRRSGLTRAASLEQLRDVFADIRAAVMAGGRVVVPGFGVFVLRRRRARRIRNPATKRLMRLPAVVSVGLRASKYARRAR